MLLIFLLSSICCRALAQNICKAGYSYNAPTNYCYKYVPYPTSWQNALTACRSDGGDLISITSATENNMLDQLALANSGLQKIWIGFYLDTTYTWRWTDNSPVTFTNWYQNYPSPNNMAGCPNVKAPFSTPNMACADFQPTGFPCNAGGNFWENSYSCTGQALPYVCKQKGCNFLDCHYSCINRGCQSGTCNIGCPATPDPTAPCNPAYALSCTCDVCTNTPCAQPGGADNGVWQTTCPSVGCNSGDCFEGITICTGCPNTPNTMPAFVYQSSPIGTCVPQTCNSFCQQNGCRSGACDLYYSGVADNPCACDTCLDPSVPYCTQTNCNNKCTQMGCHHGNCDLGICNCFICPNNVNTGK